MRTVVPMTARPPHARPAVARRPRALAIVAGLLVLAGLAPVGTVGAVAPAGQPAAGDPAATLQPTVQYEEAVAHANDTTRFAPGARVTVPFTPRGADRWTVGGVQPRALPAGRLSGTAMRATSAAPGRKSGATSTRAPSSGAPVGAADVPYVDPSGAIAGTPAAAVDPGGLKREVFGFLPYWELTDPSTRLDWEKLSTVAYFGVGAAANGDLQKRNSDGSTDGRLERLDELEDDGRHERGACERRAGGPDRPELRLVVEPASPARRPCSAARPIGPTSPARSRPRCGIVAPTASISTSSRSSPTYADEFTALVRTVRSELNRVHAGYQLTFDTFGWVGNYPIEKGTAAGRGGRRRGHGLRLPGRRPRARSGRSRRSAGRPTTSRTRSGPTSAGSPPRRSSSACPTTAGPGRPPPRPSTPGTSRAPSTAPRRPSSTARPARSPPTTAASGTRTEGSAWVVYRRKNCTARYGCVNPYRQVYYDDATALGLKYDLINRANLRGAGIWALGYDGTRPELYAVLKAKFITDKVPPRITAAALTSPVVSPNGDGRSDTVRLDVAVTGHIRFGWVVQPHRPRGRRAARSASASKVDKRASYTWDGRTNARRSRSPTASTGSRSGRPMPRTTARPVARSSPSTPGGRDDASSLGSAFISPDGDGQADRSALVHARRRAA